MAGRTLQGSPGGIGKYPGLYSGSFPREAQVPLARQGGGAHHGLLHLHLDDVFIDVITFIFTWDTVVNVLTQVMFAAQGDVGEQGRKVQPSELGGCKAFPWHLAKSPTLAQTPTHLQRGMPP